MVKLLQPALRGEAQVVYDTRTSGSHRAFPFCHVLGNKAVTMCANALFNTWTSDLETCYRLMPLALCRDLDIRFAGIGTEAEVTGKLLRRAPISQPHPPQRGSPAVDGQPGDGR
jgi:dolichol-phosphate hexosyltransferase